jgi:hypothetical protein
MTSSRRLVRLTTIGVIALFSCGAFAAPAEAVNVPGHYPTIQAAINAVLSGAQPNGTTIDVQPGTYAETLFIADTSRSFTVRGVGGANVTIVNAAGRGAVALLVARAPGRIVFEGLTFRNGGVATSPGGGAYLLDASPRFTNCVFESNVALDGGGAALIRSNAVFEGCAFRSNSAARYGGGVYLVGGSRPVFTRCDVVSNASGTAGPSLGNGVGGGLHSSDSSPVIRGSRIAGNSSRFAAGGIYHIGVFDSPYGVARLLIEDSEIADNVSTPIANPSEGGGIHIEDNAIASLIRARVLRNQAGTGGGLNAYRARYDIFDSVVDSNVATSGIGGGITASSTNVGPSRPSSVVNVTQTLVRNNTGVTGGGIVVTGDVGLPASLTVASSVVDSNHASNQGGGILLSRANLNMTNSLVIRNTVSGGAVPFGGGLLISTESAANISNSTLASNASSSYGGGIFMDQTATLNINSSQVYANSAAPQGGGIFVGPNGIQAGSITNSILADNSNYQIAEHKCPALTLTYQNNTIVGSSGVFTGACGFTTSSVATFNGHPSGKASGNNANAPTFARFLAVPRVGPSTLAWSVGRATSVTISGVGTFSQATRTVDVAPTGSTTYNLSAVIPGGSVGPVPTSVVVGTPWGSAGSSDVAVPADYDGDGKADMAIYRLTTGEWFVIRSSNSTLLHVQWGAPALGDTPVVADYDGDGRADVAVYRLSTGEWFIIRSSNSTLLQVGWGVPALGDVPVINDYDGDGRADIAIYRLSTGEWYVIRSTNSTLLKVGWGAPQLGDVPVVGDFDGDGRADVAVYRQSTGGWFIIRSSNSSLMQVNWGNPQLGDVPVPADYDGDGRTDVAVARAATGEWYLNRSSAGGTSFVLGLGDARVPADYDGDGDADAAIWRGGTGSWLRR